MLRGTNLTIKSVIVTYPTLNVRNHGNLLSMTRVTTRSGNVYVKHFAVLFMHFLVMAQHTLGYGIIKTFAFRMHYCNY